MGTARQLAIDAILDEAVREGAVPNVVAVAADRDGILYEGACGARLPERPESGPVTQTTPYRLMSMTRPVVTVAALALMQEGKLDLDAPVEEYVAQFAEVRVLEGFDEHPPMLRDPASKATVGQLMSHISGLGDWSWESALVEWDTRAADPDPLSVRFSTFDAPMVADPGTRFVYGISTEWLGRVIEEIERRPLPEVIARRVTGPLGMDGTGFQLGNAQRAELVPVCVRDNAGRWAPSAIELPADPEDWSAGTGLYGTARDYLRFTAMLLGEGQAPDWAGGARILEPETTRAAFIDRTGGQVVPGPVEPPDPRTSAAIVLGPGEVFGYGLMITTIDQPRRRRAGTGSWGGIFNTRFWVDPAAGVTGVLLSNCLPYMEAGPADTLLAFERMLYASL